MNLNRAAMFAHVVDAGGFSAAARKLGVPKTTISKRVGDLETELGVRLLNRTTRQVSLTEAGTRLYAHCQQALRQMDLAEREVKALQSEPEGLLRVGAPSAIGVRFLLPLIIDMMDQYSGLRVSLIAVNDDVHGIDDSIDVLIWPGVLRQNVHAVRLVAQVEIGLYASKAYVDSIGAPRAPSELEGHNVVAFTQAFSGGRFSWELNRGRTSVTVKPEAPPRFLSNDAVAIMAATCAGQGIGALPVGYVDQSPEGTALIRVLPEWQAAQIELNAFFRDGSASSAKTRLFLDLITRWFLQ
jgi:LysR family transcriptional regulator, regulator for bpeEF and oprC